MRLILLAVCVMLLGGVAWFAVERGSDTPGLRGIAQIEAKVVAETRAAISGTASPAITVLAKGRQVTLSGPVESEEKRQAILAAARTARLVAAVDDRILVVQTVRPFTFSAEKAADGGLVLTGHVPTRAAEDQILVQARLSANGEPVRSELVVAAGVPEGDWTAVVLTGLSALEPLNAGTVSLSDLDVVLSGIAPDADAVEQIEATIASAPAGDWSLDLAGAVPLADPFRFTALLTTDGSVIVGGHAPDDDTRLALLAAAEAIGNLPVDGQIAIARGMPDGGWPGRVRQGIEALGAADAGFLNIEGNAVTLTAEVQTDDDRQELATLVGPDWIVEITVINPEPPAVLAVELLEDGTTRIGGLLPGGLDREALGHIFPGALIEETQSGAGGSATDWEPAFEALRIVLPRLASATARVGTGQFSLTGVLKRGFSAEGSRAAVRTVMPREWNVTLDLTESAPLAELILVIQGDEIVLTGLLPQDLTVAAALDLLGDRASSEELASVGEGDAEAWTAALSVLAEGIGFFDEATGRVAEGSLALRGLLRPGYAANEVQEWLEARVASGWSVGLTARETTPSEGDIRVNLATGAREHFRSGHWLAEEGFPVSAERCATEADEILAERSVRFIPASARIDSKALPLIDSLAAIAIRCLNGPGLRLEIAGHTDSVGNDEGNQRLSEARAKAVLAALAERGVWVDAMTSVGHGETRPVADNATPEGRAANRRIEFSWHSGSN